MGEHDEVVVHEWPGFYLRDDRATGIRDDEAYSLFRLEPYGRETVYAGRLEWAVKEASLFVEANG